MVLIVIAPLIKGNYMLVHFYFRNKNGLTLGYVVVRFVDVLRRWHPVLGCDLRSFKSHPLNKNLR